MSRTLTDKYIESLALARDGQHIIRDDHQPGFFVIVGRRNKTYYVQFDYHDPLGRRKTCRKKIGRVDQIDVKQARAKAAQMIADAKAPVKQQDVTLAVAWCEYRDLHLVPQKRSARTIEGYQDAVERLLGDWQNVPLDRLAAQPVEVNKRYVALLNKHGIATAKNAMTTFRAIYNHALNLHPELARPNPVRFNLQSPAPRHTAMAAEDLSGWYKQLRKLPCPVRRAYHLLMLLSGCRRESLSCARWADIDVAHKSLRIPKPKGGTSRAFDIPLSRRMLWILAKARRAGRMLNDESEWIFPSAASRSGHIEEIKEKNLVTGHTLRHTYRTLAQQAGVSELDAMLIMNHKLPGGANSGYISRTALWPHLLTVQETMSTFIMEHCI